MFGKTLIVDIKAETTEILYQEHGSSAGIALAESVNLPNAGYEPGYMVNRLLR